MAVLHARQSNSSLSTAKPTERRGANGCGLMVGLFAAITFISLLCFWSMAPAAFNAPRTMHGFWEGESITPGTDDTQHISVEFIIPNQITESVVGLYTVGNINADGSPVMVGARALRSPLVFSQIQMKGVLWSASAACGDDGETCAFAVRKGEALLSIFSEGHSADYILHKRGFSNSVFSDEGGQHKLRYGFVIFVVVVFLKILVSKLQSPSEKRVSSMSRRRRNFM